MIVSFSSNVCFNSSSAICLPMPGLVGLLLSCSYFVSHLVNFLLLSSSILFRFSVLNPFTEFLPCHQLLIIFCFPIFSAVLQVINIISESVGGEEIDQRAKLFFKVSDLEEKHHYRELQAAGKFRHYYQRWLGSCFKTSQNIHLFTQAFPRNRLQTRSRFLFSLPSSLFPWWVITLNCLFSVYFPSLFSHGQVEVDWLFLVTSQFRETLASSILLPIILIFQIHCALLKHNLSTQSSSAKLLVPRCPPHTSAVHCNTSSLRYSSAT